MSMLSKAPALPCESDAARKSTLSAPKSRLWIWFVVAFAVQLAVWTAWFVIASHHKVQEVPVVVPR